MRDTPHTAMSIAYQDHPFRGSSFHDNLSLFRHCPIYIDIPDIRVHINHVINVINLMI